MKDIYNENNRPLLKEIEGGDHQDGGRVRYGDQLHPHKYIRNTSTCGTIPTEHLLNTARRPQTFQTARSSPHTWVRQKKQQKTETKVKGRDLHQWEGAVKEEKFPHTRKPIHWRRQGVEGGKLRGHRGQHSNRGA